MTLAPAQAEALVAKIRRDVSAAVERSNARAKVRDDLRLLDRGLHQDAGDSGEAVRSWFIDLMLEQREGIVGDALPVVEVGHGSSVRWEVPVGVGAPTVLMITVRPASGAGTVSVAAGPALEDEVAS